MSKAAGLAAIALGGLAIVLPGVAHDGSQTTMAALDTDPALLFPAPISSEHFSDFYAHPIGASAELARS